MNCRIIHEVEGGLIHTVILEGVYVTEDLAHWWRSPLTGSVCLAARTLVAGATWPSLNNHLALSNTCCRQGPLQNNNITVRCTTPNCPNTALSSDNNIEYTPIYLSSLQSSKTQYSTMPGNFGSPFAL